MILKAVVCLNCNDILYPRCKKDLRGCSCGKVFIEGNKITAEDDDDFIWTEVVIPENISADILYDDWNLRKNKYGRIKGE